MALYNVYNSKHERLGSYNALGIKDALTKAERGCIEGGSRWIGGYVKLAADDKQPPRPNGN